MADTQTPAERSENMSRIRSTNTKPEEIVRKYLFKHGFRYRKNDKRYPGKPDIVLPKYRTVIFVNGCFWHMHNCSRSRLPRSNQEYWNPKLSATSNEIFKTRKSWKQTDGGSLSYGNANLKNESPKSVSPAYVKKSKD